MAKTILVISTTPPAASRCAKHTGDLNTLLLISLEKTEKIMYYIGLSCGQRIDDIGRNNGLEGVKSNGFVRRGYIF